ncbi:MAG: hypothetical protein OXU73_02975 [Candidatus Campbellbacteria bacterium]|nr:hypothetical protein [Candidatus Campbellbacteria bacterium]
MIARATEFIVLFYFVVLISWAVLIYSDVPLEIAEILSVSGVFLFPYFTMACVLIALIAEAHRIRLNYLQAAFISKQDYRLLELKMPATIERSPEAMDIILNRLNLTLNETNWSHTIWLGKVRPTWSFEIISAEGQIRMFIRIPNFHCHNVRTSIYSYYPEIQIEEVNDYVEEMTFNHKKDRMWGCMHKLKEKRALPLRTYLDYNIHSGKTSISIRAQRLGTETGDLVDPMAPMIEAMGTLGVNEHMWVQFLIRAHKKNSIQKGFFGHYSHKKEVKEVLDGVKGKKKGSEESKEDIGKFERELVDNITRNASKPQFDVGIRTLYFTKGEESFNATNIVELVSLLKSFKQPKYNFFSPMGGHTIGNYSWGPFVELIGLYPKGTVAQDMSKLLYRLYCDRTYFYPILSIPERYISVMSSESLATLIHPIGSHISTPTMPRVLSKKKQAPSNLPV